jgi:hypothetical protein
MKEIATKALDKTKNMIKTLSELLSSNGEMVTLEKIGAIVVSLYLIAVTAANIATMPYLITWLLIILPVLMMLLSAAAVTVSDKPIWQDVWLLVSTLSQTTVFVTALLANMLPIILFYSIPMYMLHRLTDTVVEERMKSLATKLHSVAFQPV